MSFNFDQDWVNSEGQRLKIYQMTPVQYGQVDPNPMGIRFALIDGCPAIDVRRLEVGFGRPASFTTYQAGQRWLEITYKKMLNQAKRRGLIK